jgi:tRNA-specific 2-thiouridylase
MSRRDTAIAMSGGLDSSVTAWLLSQQGSALAGLSMLLWDGAADPGAPRCCGALDLMDARRAAEQCGLPHYVVSMEEEFRRYVVDPYVDDYLGGRTPLPCTRCNTWIKFDLFLERARSIGAPRIATGHYARIVRGADGLELHRAVDLDKDQSYYLFELTQEQLAASEFPLGGMTKRAVRDLAREAGLLVAEKAESMDTCFVSRGVRSFVEEQIGSRPDRFQTPVVGEGATVVDESGTVLGSGEPFYRYTVGQRRGLGVATGERLYVLEVEPKSNTVVVGSEESLLSSGLEGERLHWIGPHPDGPVEVTVKIRSRHPGVDALVTPGADGRVVVEFDSPQKGVAPGQAAVFYRGSRVLGGCWISAGRSRTRDESPVLSTRR